MKKFWRSKTLWLNLATLPTAAFLTEFLGAEVALKVSVAVNSLANLVLRLFFTDTALEM